MATLSATSYRSDLNLPRQLRDAQTALDNARRMVQEMEPRLERIHDLVMNDPNPFMITTLSQCLTIMRSRQYQVIQAEACVKRIESRIRLLNSAA